MQNTALQGHQQAAQYVYSSNSYTGQQGAAPASANSAAYAPQAYAQQSYPQQSYVQQVQVQQPQAAVSQPTYGSNTTYGAVGAASQTQSAQPQAVPWSQQASAATAQPAPQQQSAYGRSSTGVASAASGGGSSGGAAQYGGQYNSVYGTAVQSNPQQVQQVQQALGSTARGVVSPDFQAQTTAGSRGSAAYGQGPDRAMNTGASYVVGGASSVSASGVYGADAAKYDDNDKYGAGASSGSYDGKNSDYGAASSPSGYSQKAPDQYGANYNIKSSDYSQSDRAQYGQNQSAYGQADSQGGAARRYHDTQAAIAVAQQRQQQQQQQQQHQQQERQDQQSQLIRQQQALQAQAQQQAAAALLSRGAASSVLDGGARNQNDYLGGSRAGPARGGSQEYGQVRGLLGPSYGGSRSDADAGLLVSQYGGAGGRSTGPVNSIGYGAQQAGMYAALNAGRGMTGQMYAHSAPVIGYGGVQLPPGREYSAGRGTGGGGYIAGGSRSDRPSIGSSRFEDRRDDRPPPRRDGGRDDRRGGGIVGGGGRDRERDRLRNRDRERDTHRDRRDDLRKRERSPLRPARDHKDPMPGKRDDRSGRKESPRLDLPHRVMSPAKEKRRDYLCKIEQFNIVDAERDYTTLCKRYGKLYVVPEFAKLAVCWLGKESQIRLSQPISFEHDAVDVEDEGDSKEAPPKSSDKVSPSPATFPTKGTTTWNSKVMLMSGFSEAALVELLSDSNVEDKPPHLHNLLKFVALRKDRSAIMACGGAWDKDLDGGDPATDEDALIRTAIRCTKQSTQLDLSSCTQWLRFLEVHYERLGEDGLPSHNDVTVLYVPDLSQVVPLLEDWQQQWTQWKQAKLDREAIAKGEKEVKPAEKKSEVMEVEGNGTKDVEEASARVEGETLQDDIKDAVVEEKVDTKPEEVVGKGKATEVSKDIVVKPEEDLPQQPGLLLTTRRTKSTKMRSMTISLDGLLDYDEEDREECTFELSVFAEVYQEMLEYKMGSLILSDLEVLRATVYARKREERKRLRTAGKDETLKEVEGEGSSSRKRSKFSDKAGTPEPKMEIELLPDTELVPESKIEIAPETAIEIVTELKIETLLEPQSETVESDTVPEVVPENRLEIEASEILNANSEEDLRKLVAKKEEAVVEQEKVMVDSLAEKAEENGDGHKDDKKELDGVFLSEAEVGQGATDIVVDMPEVAITTASSDVDMNDAVATKERGSAELVEDKKLEKKQHVLSKEVLQAYRYFDRHRVGYLKADDVRRLLHSLGRFLSHRNVKELVACAVAESSKTRDERVVYRSFTEKETTTE